jgi:hypothetical protein
MLRNLVIALRVFQLEFLQSDFLLQSRMPITVYFSDRHYFHHYFHLIPMHTFPCILLSLATYLRVYIFREVHL